VGTVGKWRGNLEAVPGWVRGFRARLA